MPRSAIFASLAMGVVLGFASGARAQGQPVTFSVTGDIPYAGREDLFRTFVADHNRMSPSEFFFHVGDIKSEASGCLESFYAETFDTMSGLAVPSFIVPGDNEWNDCADPDAAWLLWESYFADFEQNFCGAPAVEAQAVRHENFAFVHQGVLFIGLNLVGGLVHDPNEWAARLQQDADWVDQQLSEKAAQVRAAVLFAQAGRSGNTNPFYDQFDAAAGAFGKPILFIHGDDHEWLYTPVWGHANVSRISIQQDDPPLEVTVGLGQNPFSFERVPWPAGTPDLNLPPCVDAGPDATITLGDGVSLDGFASDDGVPGSGSLSAVWSTVSGPGAFEAVFADPNAEVTSATFPAAGDYVLRLTASDGELATSDDLAVQVDPPGPALRVRDASLVEGDSGTTAAGFTVDLLAATGASVSVDYDTADGSASAGEDYQATSGTLFFSGATTAQTIAVPVNGDTLWEASEDFVVNLSGAAGAVIADGQATGLIIDDDAPAPVIGSFAPAMGPPGTVVSLSGQFFSDAVAVAVGGVPAAFSVLSDTLIELTIPGHGTSGPISVTNGAGTTPSAGVFTLEFFLVVSTTGSGSVDLQPPGGRYPEGTVVTLQPLPAPGWEFLVWSGDLGGIVAPESVTMSSDVFASASFVVEGSVLRVTQTQRVAASDDDAEERVDGNVKIPSKDLELGDDHGAPQTVGIRFPGLDIPPGATILSASLQFTADETSIGSASLTIRGQDANDAQPFVDVDGDVTARRTTAALATWDPPDWSLVGESGPAQRTPDLAPLVQAIVGRPGWTPGNALAFLITGEGSRTAEAYDGVAASAPLLEVVYQDEPDVEAPTPPANLVSPAQTSVSIDLSWDAATDDVGVTGYRVYGPNGTTDVAGTSHVETGLIASTAYDFQVTALDEAGNESGPTPVLTAYTAPPDLEPPSAPGNLHSPAQTGTTISLAWDPATDDVGVTGYRVYGPNGATDVAGTGHVETGLDPATVYGFQVTALDLAGNESAPSASLAVSTGAAEPVALAARIATSTDDVEERLSSGTVSITSADLELAVDGTRDLAVGLRFPGLEIPQGATILSASLQFTVDEVTGGPVSLEIRGIASDDAPPFAAVDGDVTVRPTTSAARAWSPPDWTAVGSAGPDQRTPDLAPLVQEVVGRPGWGPGNALAFVITGSGTRTAEAYDGVAAAAPLLELVYLDGPDFEAPTPPANLTSPAQTSVSIDLAWDAASDNVGVTGYRVYGPNGTTDVSGTAHVETGLSAATSYDFQVSALDDAGNESLLTPVLTVSTTTPDLEPPSPPQNLLSPSQTGSTIGLTWDPASDNVGVSGYRVYGPNGVTDVAGTSHVETGLAPLTEYIFQVSALDAAGNQSALSAALYVSTTPAEPVALSVRIASSADDAEQRLAKTTVSITSADLELAVDRDRDLAVGMRFAGLDIPQGATILSASVQFTVDEVSSGPISLTIRGQDADDAAPFAAVSNDVTARPTTAASAAWSPPDWLTVGAAGAAQRTPDLAAVLQAVVSRPGWAPGNAVALVVTGSGSRIAEAYDGVAEAAPLLDVVYLEGPAP